MPNAKPQTNRPARPIWSLKLVPRCGMVLGTWCLVLWPCATSHAQLVADSATNTLANVTTNITGTLTVGTNGSFTLLVLSNNAVVTNTLNGVIGRSAAAKSNAVQLISASARWQMGADLFVGSNGAFNRLVVSNGARVDDNNSFIGIGAASSNNEVVVTGVGSLWTNRTDLYLGEFGSSGNRLMISDGGQVGNNSGLVGFAPSSLNNSVLVAGAGSMWSNRTSVAVGYSGNANLLTISNGGVVISGDGYVGLFTSSNNQVVVTGAGSTWSNRLDLNVGFNGPFNRLVVGNAAAVMASNMFVGFSASSTNNRVTVDGGTLRVTNATGTGVLDVRRGTKVLNSGTVDVDWLVLTNESQGKFEFNGGTLITRGLALVTTNPLAVFAVNRNGATPATWDVRAGVSNYFLPAAIYVGSNSSFNQLLITNGAVLQITRGTLIGANTGANSNLAVVAGIGTALSNAGALQVGERGSFNELVVSNGALVVSSQGSFSSFGGSNNTALVTGAGSVWRAGVLDLRAGSVLVISNGGTVLAPNGVDASGNATNNRIVVAGGTLLATNAAGNAILDIRGTNVLNAGWIEADLLIMTNLFGLPGFFEFNGGTFKPRATAYDNGRVFTVGNGVSAATLQLSGGTHRFANGLLITNNGTLTGNGTIAGTTTVSGGGTLAPGDGVTTLIFSNTPSLNGIVAMQVFKIGNTRFNNQIQVAATLLYGGALDVSNVGAASFVAGDNFKLFNATAYESSFSVIMLPPLNAGLGWTNKLLVDGSIEVVVAPQPKFSNISVSGTNVIISGSNGLAGANYAVLTATNVTTPLSNWVSIVTNQFGAGGAFSFTNPIVPGIPQSYFRLRTP